MKRFFKCICILLLCVLLAVPVCAENTDEYEPAAWGLYELGLFHGRGTDENGAPIFDLDSIPSRQEAVAMLLRLLGEEDMALQAKLGCPFVDVSPWAQPLIAYAYAQGLVQGVGGDRFNAETAVTAAEYITMVLRAMNYSSEVDFEWQQAWKLSDALGFTDGRYDKNEAFTRGDMALIAYHALSAPMKNGKTIFERLNESYLGFGRVEQAEKLTAEGEEVKASLRLIQAVIAGKSQLFIHLEDTEQLLKAAGTDAVFVRENKAMGMDYYELTTTITVGERSLSFTQPGRGVSSYTRHDTQGVCWMFGVFAPHDYGAGYEIYVNANELLDHFGLSQKLELATGTSGRCWRLS